LFVVAAFFSGALKPGQRQPECSDILMDTA
jgi:hypothetical protein